MSNHFFDWERKRTRCDEYGWPEGWHVSANNAVSCPDCWDSLTPDERKGQWYDRSD